MGGFKIYATIGVNRGQPRYHPLRSLQVWWYAFIAITAVQSCSKCPNHLLPAPAQPVAELTARPHTSLSCHRRRRRDRRRSLNRARSRLRSLARSPARAKRRQRTFSSSPPLEECCRECVGPKKPYKTFRIGWSGDCRANVRDHR